MIVTVGTRGIGFAIAEAFCKEGYKVIIGDINEEAAKDGIRDNAIMPGLFKTELLEKQF